MKDLKQLKQTIAMLESLKNRLETLDGNIDSTDFLEDINKILYSLKNHSQSNGDILQNRKIFSKLILLVKLLLNSDDLN